MTPVLTKLLTPFIHPLGLCCMVWIVAGILYWRQLSRWGMRFLLAGIMILGIFSNGFVAAFLLGSLEKKHPVKAVEAMPQADAIVVLGGVTLPPQPPRLDIDVSEGFDRLLHGMRLWRAGKAPRLVLTGGALPALLGSHMTEADALQQLALEYGIADTALVLEEQAQNTYENAYYSQQVLAPFKVQRLILVTSASHMPRSMAVFRKFPFEVVPAATDIRIVDKPFTLRDIIPTATALYRSSIAFKEYFGLVYYWLRGWV